MPRILIADDSPTAREMLAAILQSDADIEVVGFATNGRQAISETMRLKPDLITMDINMPDLDGFQATKEIMIECPTPIVIISASLKAREIKCSMQALQAGALTVLSKPTGVFHADFQHQAAEIIQHVKALADVVVIRHHRTRDTPSAAVPALEAEVQRVAEQRTGAEIPCIGIVASTGGPPALATLLRGLTPDFPASIVVVQHIVGAFADGFVHWLNSVSPLTVKTAIDREPLEPGVVFIAPHGRHVGVDSHSRIELSDGDAIGGFRPAGDHLFNTLALSRPESSLAIIMTGMGQDGVDGIVAMHAAGGHTVAQDEESSIIYGMPRAAVERNAIDVSLAVDEIPVYLTRWAVRTGSSIQQGLK